MEEEEKEEGVLFDSPTHSPTHPPTHPPRKLPLRQASP